MEKSFTVTSDPELSEEWGRLHALETTTRLLARRGEGTVKASAESQLADVEAQKQDLEPKIVAAARVITVERIHPKEYLRLLLAHPPREGDEYDARMGFNTDTFDAELMDRSITRVVDGNDQPVDWDWSTLVEQMSMPQYQELITTVMGMYDSRDAVPFSLADWHKTHS